MQDRRAQPERTPGAESRPGDRSHRPVDPAHRPVDPAHRPVDPAHSPNDGYRGPDLDEIRESFAFFDSWEDKYRFVIDLGKDLPDLDQALKTEDNLVRGCQSQVWLVAGVDPETGRMRLRLDSDAHIVRGLIAIVLAAYDGRTPQEIVDFDMTALFDELDLLPHLSATRGNGLRAMVEAIRMQAADARP